MKQKLIPIEVPWMISPSVSDIHVSIQENGKTQIAVDVCVLSAKNPLEDELDDKRILIEFSIAQWVRTYPVVNDESIYTEDFDLSQINLLDSENLEESLAKFRQQWFESGICPDTLFYSVKNSIWEKETGSQFWGCNHYIIIGHDFWLELLAKSYSWIWVETKDNSIRTDSFY